MKALLLTFFVALSCTKYAEIDRQSMGSNIKGIRMDLSDLHEITWLVGKNREGKVTQSFTFILELPKLRGDDLDYLIKKKELDAWIIRIIQVQGSTRNDLGSLYVPFSPKKKGRGLGDKMASRVSVKVLYAAAYASERFRTFNCPAFGHDKRIEDMEIKGEVVPLEIALNQSSPYQEKAQLAHLTPSSFNAGNDLKGEYHLEMAPYNSQKKHILGGFTRIPRYVEVKSERSQGIESCMGVHQERTN